MKTCASQLKVRAELRADWCEKDRRMETIINEQLLDQKLAVLEEAQTWSPRLISKLENYIRTADDQDLFRINALSFANERNLSENEAIDLFLHSTALGLFVMDWSLLCPQCCCVVESFRSLNKVHNHYHCPFCQVGYDAVLDEFVSVTFTIRQNIREIEFHNLDQLSAWDRFFKTQNAAEGVLPDGRSVMSVKAAFTRAVNYLPSGTIKSIEVEVNEGTIMGSCPSGKAAILVAVSGKPSQDPQIVPVSYGDKVYIHDV